MKKILSLVVGCLSFISLSAQDKIVFRNAEVMDAFGVDVGEKSLFYRLGESEESPWCSVNKSQVLMIKYENGTTSELFQQEEDASLKEMLSLSKDKIITRAADVIAAFGVDFSEYYVYYKAENMQHAPLLRLSREKVLLVKREDGSVLEVFKEGGPTAGKATAHQQPVQVATAGNKPVAEEVPVQTIGHSEVPTQGGTVSEAPTQRGTVKHEEPVLLTAKHLNRALLSKNQRYVGEINTSLQIDYQDKKYWKKKADLLIAQMGVKENSVIFDGYLQIRFHTGELTRYRHSQPLHFTLRNSVSEKDINDPALLVSVENKSNKTLYLDLSHTYLARMNDSIYYYSSSSAHKANSGVTVDLGAEKKTAGAVANGGGISSVNPVYQQSVAIAPKSVIYLNPQYLLRTNEGEVTPGLDYLSRSFDKSAVEHIPHFSFNPKMAEDIMVGQPIAYKEENSPLQMTLVVSYSEDQNCEKETRLPVFLYLKELVGVDPGNFTITDSSQRLFFGAGLEYDKKKPGFPVE